MFLAIDPGTHDFGYALFNLQGILQRSGAFHMTKYGDWLARIDKVVALVLILQRYFGVQSVAIEMPSNFGNAASSGQSILKLMGCVMALRQALQSKGACVRLVPVLEWKGSLPKAVTTRRVRQKYGWKGKSLDEADAIGIGDYVLQTQQRRISKRRVS